MRIIIIALVLIALIFIGISVFYSTKSINELLNENKKLKQAITRLIHEDQIGYAKVIKQEAGEDGTVYTTLKFVETDRSDKLKTILEKEYTIEGDVIHFDALIVSFPTEFVMDGKERSLYLWRRIYGENMTPADGFPIEEMGKEPERYRDLLERLRTKDKETFWDAMWCLSNDPDALNKHGIRAIYGNVVYKKLKPGVIYVFKISPTGQLYPETVPDM